MSMNTPALPLHKAVKCVSVSPHTLPRKSQRPWHRNGNKLRSPRFTPSRGQTLPSATSAALSDKVQLVTKPYITEMMHKYLGAATDPVVFVATRIAVDILLLLALVAVIEKLVIKAAERAQDLLDDDVVVKRGLPALSLLALALKGPCRVLLSWAMIAYSLRTSAHITHSYMTTFRAEQPAGLGQIQQVLAASLQSLDVYLAQGLRVMFIIGGCWVAVKWKDVLIEYLLKVQRLQKGNPDAQMQRALAPLGSIFTWVICVAGAMSVANTLGINIQPLLTVGGAGGVLAAFASQQVLTNAVNGLSLFLTRPFVVGESITLRASSLELSGVVKEVQPMRTLLANDDGVIITVPNKMVNDMIIINRSRTSPGPPRAFMPGQQQLKFRLRLDRAQLGDLNLLRSEVKQFLADDVGGVVRISSIHCDAFKLMDKEVEMAVRCQLCTDTQQAAIEATESILLAVAGIAAKYGGVVLSS